jgi:hypothetical protein
MLQITASHYNNPGEEADKVLPFKAVLSELGDATCARRLQLAAAADDLPVTFGEASALYLVSRNGERFGWRLAAGETLVENQLAFLSQTRRTTDASGLQTSILLTGNGSTICDLEIWIVEKTTP